MDPASSHRAALRSGIEHGSAVAAGAFTPFVARLIEGAGFDAVYVSGAALSNSLGRPDEGLLSRRRVLEFTREVVSAVDLPVIVDVDTGFGGPRGVARTAELFEAAGAAAIQIEDQDPRYKRCGHLGGTRLISAQRMAAKLAAAVAARRDRNFLIVARTDARSVEGLDGAIERARRYVQAGGDVIFPEALQSLDEFRAVREALAAPLLANMTEFGRTPWITDAQFAEIGYGLVIHPATTFRLAAKAVKAALDEMRRAGYQRHLVDSGALMTRSEVDRYLVPRDGAARGSGAAPAAPPATPVAPRR